ncbi:nonsense-mediated mRNA decay factor SMG5-like [Macrotis lagotis]|uniref:nonsense-mediated mRNA decay factor SMG5-like n=1 Tax=Macrotis lagotis TaxID=92651 RepID=UPI003D6986CF
MKWKTKCQCSPKVSTTERIKPCCGLHWASVSRFSVSPAFSFGKILSDSTSSCNLAVAFGYWSPDSAPFPLAQVLQVFPGFRVCLFVCLFLCSFVSFHNSILFVVSSRTKGFQLQQRTSNLKLSPSPPFAKACQHKPKVVFLSLGSVFGVGSLWWSCCRWLKVHAGSMPVDYHYWQSSKQLPSLNSYLHQDGQWPSCALALPPSKDYIRRWALLSEPHCFPAPCETDSSRLGQRHLSRQTLGDLLSPISLPLEDIAYTASGPGGLGSHSTGHQTEGTGCFGTMELSQTKQLLLKMVQSAQQLDIILARETAPQEVFQAESVALRAQMQQLILPLIFLSPGHHGMEVEALLWKRAYADVQRLRKTKRWLMDRCSPEGAFLDHLIQGVHLYQGMFYSVQAFFLLKLDSYMDWMPPSPVSPAPREAGSPSLEEMAWARQFCHGCLLRIGDLYHALREFLGSCAEKQAENYYYKALALIPDMGSPFIHLATLSGDKDSFVEAAYFYQCSIHSKVPPVGAASGLEQLYLKIEKLHRQLAGGPEGKLSPESKPGGDIQRMLVSFLYLQSLLNPGGRKDSRLERLCEVVLEDFELCLSGLGLGGPQEHGSPLPSQVIFQMVVLCLLSVHSLKKTNVELSRTSVAFSLAFFSPIVVQVREHLQAGLQNRLRAGSPGTAQLKPGQARLEEGQRPREPDPDDPASAQSGSSERGQQPPFSTQPPALSWEDREPMQVSDLDESSDSYGVLDDSEDWGDVSLCSLPDTEGSVGALLSEAKADGRPSREESQAKLLKLQEKLQVVSGESLLPTVKVILQWLCTEQTLTVLSMHTCPGLWRDLLVVLNLMPTAEELGNPSLGLAPWLRELLPVFQQAVPPKIWPLPEDVILHRLLPSQAAHPRLDFDLDMPLASSREEAALRACTLRTLGQHAAQLPTSLIRFDPTQGLFVQIALEVNTPSQKQTAEGGTRTCIKDIVVHQQLQKELELMERHLQLLQAHVALSPYLILDSLALCHYLSLVREMARSGRFLILIPRLVIDDLDRSKKQALPRHALRFLEEELKNRNPYLRCQVRVREKCTEAEIESAHLPARNLWGILFSYQDLMDLAGPEAEDVRGMVTILTALSFGDPNTFSPSLKQAFWAAHRAGVAIQHILPFYHHWKDLS